MDRPGGIRHKAQKSFGSARSFVKSFVERHSRKEERPSKDLPPSSQPNPEGPEEASISLTRAEAGTFFARYPQDTTYGHTSQLNPPEESHDVRPLRNFGAIHDHERGFIWSRSNGPCDICNDLNIREDPEHSLIRLPYFELAESALLGCRYCALISQSFETQAVRVSELYNIVSVVARANEPFYISCEDETTGQVRFQIYAPPNALSTFPELGYATDVASNPASEETFDQIENWIAQCQVNHPECSLLVNGRRPRRLIDVGNSDAGISPKLVEDAPEDSPYIALSHCWGGENSFIMTRSTLFDRLSDIDWTSLPKTFQDTITVARRLKISYVWIDSLCIIQDDMHDWELESANMGNIYEGSFLTIAAANAASDSTGFLHCTAGRLAYVSKDVKMDGMSNIRVRPIHDTRVQFSKEPLMTRAWTLQERLLPRRLLSFSSAVTWECSQDWCECGSDLFPDPFLGDEKGFNWPSRKRFREATDKSTITGVTTLPYGYWYSCVMTYMLRGITRDSDRLPAISAIASKLQRRKSERYLAGLWLDDIAYGMSWHRASAKDVGPDDIAPVATSHCSFPSWSWMSCRDPVSFDVHYEFRRSEISVLQAKCNLSTANEFGMTMDGALVLKGKTVQAQLRSYSLANTSDADWPYDPYIRTYSLTKPGHDKTSFRNMEDAPLMQRPCLQCNSEAQGLRKRKCITVQRATQVLTRTEYVMEVIDAEVLCLLIGTGRVLGQEARNFLILGRLKHDPPTFQRLGWLLVRQGDGPEWFEEMQEEVITLC